MTIEVAKAVPKEIRIKNLMAEWKFTQTQRGWVNNLLPRYGKDRMLSIIETAGKLYEHIKDEQPHVKIKVIDELVEGHNYRYFLRSDGASLKNYNEKTRIIDLNLDFSEFTPEEKFTALKILTDIVMNQMDPSLHFKLAMRAGTTKSEGFITKITPDFKHFGRRL